MAAPQANDANARPLTTRWRVGLGICALVAAAVAIVLYFDPPDQTKTTTSAGKASTEVTSDRPDGLILAAAGVALVLALTALSAGGIGLSFGGVSVDVNALRDELDSTRKDLDSAVEERDSAVEVAESSIAQQAADAMAPTKVEALVDSEAFRTVAWAAADLYPALRKLAATHRPEPLDVRIQEQTLENSVFDVLQDVPGAETHDLRGAPEAGADFLVEREGQPYVAVEVRDFESPSSLLLSSACAQLAAARDELGAAFGLLVLKDESMLTGALAQPMVGITFLDRLAEDVEYLIRHPPEAE